MPYIVVTIDQDNPNRVNAQLPMDRVNALDIFAGLATVYSQFTTSAAMASL
jgi:phage tail sheath gpL-like